MKRIYWRFLSFAALLIAASLLAACGGDVTGSAAPVSSNPVAAGSGPLSPDFSVSTGQDASFSLRDHQGDVVVLYFSFPG